MTLQTMNIEAFEEMLRRIVREEINQIMIERTSENPEKSTNEVIYASDDTFRKSATKIFKSHKKVLDALA